MIWAGLSFAVLLYMGLVETMAPDAEDDSTWRSLRPILLGFAILNVALSLGIRYFLLKKLLWHADPAKVATAFAVFIVSLALAESCAIFGLVLGFMGAPLSQCLLFFALSLVALALLCPALLPPEKKPESFYR